MKPKNYGKSRKNYVMVTTNVTTKTTKKRLQIGNTLLTNENKNEYKQNKTKHLNHVTIICTHNYIHTHQHVHSFYKIMKKKHCGKHE